MSSSPDARIVDGTGAPWFRGDIGIAGDRIMAVGDLHDAAADRRIDAAGLVRRPGFIDLQGQSEFNLLVDNRAASKITQGVTTEITGEGTSIAPVNDRMHEGPGGPSQEIRRDLWTGTRWPNISSTSSGSNPRSTSARLSERAASANYVIGEDNRPATSVELDQMRQLVAQAMQDGAFGLSTALQYVPDQYASTDEIVELAKVARRYGGVYFTHQRSEGDRIFPSLDEVFAIAQRADISATIWHLKTAYSENWGKMPEVLRRIARRTRNAASMSLRPSIHTPAARTDSPRASRRGFRRAARTSCWRASRIRRSAYVSSGRWMPLGRPGKTNGGARVAGQGVKLIEVVNPALSKYEGMTFAEIGKAMGKDPRDAAMDLAVADHGESQVVISIMYEADVRAAVSDPLISYGSDSPAQAEDGPAE